MLTILLLALSFTHGVAGQGGPAIEAIRNAFTSAKVVPDVLPSFNPTAALGVIFTASEAIRVTPGENLTMARKFSPTARLTFRD
jgi:hypothetical protein